MSNAAPVRMGLTARSGSIIIQKIVYLGDVLVERLQYSNIFEAITDDAAEAADLRFRADLMLVLREYFRSQAATQAEIGSRLGIPQPRVSELMTGKIDKFSSDKLIGFLAKLGIRFRLVMAPATKAKLMRVKFNVSMPRAA